MHSFMCVLPSVCAGCAKTGADEMTFCFFTKNSFGLVYDAALLLPERQGKHPTQFSIIGSVLWTLTTQREKGVVGLQR